MNESHSTEVVEILDKDMRVIFVGFEGVAVEWVIQNPVKPHSVFLRDCYDLMSIDEWLEEWDIVHDK